jgi:hypothetical protein
MITRLYYTVFKRHIHVRPVYWGTGWQINRQNLIESFIHDLTQFGPFVALRNGYRTAAQYWSHSQQ